MRRYFKEMLLVATAFSCLVFDYQLYRSLQSSDLTSGIVWSETERATVSLWIFFLAVVAVFLVLSAAQSLRRKRHLRATGPIQFVRMVPSDGGWRVVPEES